MGKAEYILGCEKWDSDYECLLKLVKSYIIELRKVKLYGDGMVTDHFSELAGITRTLLMLVGVWSMAVTLWWRFEYYVKTEF